MDLQERAQQVRRVFSACVHAKGIAREYGYEDVLLALYPDLKMYLPNMCVRVAVGREVRPGDLYNVLATAHRIIPVGISYCALWTVELPRPEIAYL